jgi:coenzyme F420-0:L-glutamate ligase/coenzyme F420-1:gamma-L-glutamate ligase
MHHRTMSIEPLLTPTELAFLIGARTAVLATIDDGGVPRLVPICFVVSESPRLLLHSPLDEKPKQVVDPHDLERVRDILERPEVALLIDRWSEDWSRLGWLRLRGIADLVEPGASPTAHEHMTAVAALRGKYPQYETHRLEERPLIRIAIERSRSWGNLGAG